MKKEDIFKRLWENYTALNPSVQEIHDLFTNEGEKVINDHIAFRTFNNKEVNIDMLAKPFLKAGYILKGEYQFEEKKLFAKHFEHKIDNKAARIFISELLVEEFSSTLKQKVQEIINQIPQENLTSDDLILSGRLWELPSYYVYDSLRSESEYAAWLYVFGFRANHFTISVNHLKKFNTLQKVNHFLKEKGYKINKSGGELKGSPEQLLEQSSIKSETVPVSFQEGIYEIPACYYEFAKRYPDKNGKLYSGFITKSADKIFESTDYYKKKE